MMASYGLEKKRKEDGNHYFLRKRPPISVKEINDAIKHLRHVRECMKNSSYIFQNKPYKLFFITLIKIMY